MSDLDIDAIVFDVLGTLVDEPAGIRAGIRALAPAASDAVADELLRRWQHYLEAEQQRVVDGHRAYVASDVLDREAAQVVAGAAGARDADTEADADTAADTAAVAALAVSGRRPPAWSDAAAGLARFAEHFPVIGLSNASRTALLQLNAHAGLRWHQALSAEDVRTYKPAPAVYELAVAVSGTAPERLLMVAAHAWDLRGAQRLGLRTAHVARPGGDPPATSDRFDYHAADLPDLADQLGAREGLGAF